MLKALVLTVQELAAVKVKAAAPTLAAKNVVEVNVVVMELGTARDVAAAKSERERDMLLEIIWI